MYVITKEEYESLQMKLAGYEERVKSLENLIEDYRVENKRLNERAESAEGDLDNVKKDLEDVVSSVKKWQRNQEKDYK